MQAKQGKRGKTGLTLKTQWTPSRNAVIRTEYPDSDTAVLAAKLGVSSAALQMQASKIGVRKSEAFWVRHASQVGAHIAHAKTRKQAQSKNLNMPCEANGWVKTHSGWVKVEHLGVGAQKITHLAERDERC